MLTLKELRFSGIGRFVEEQSISFDNYGNIIQVDAANNNTGGSSGAGKSTVFNAIDFLFGLNSTPNTVLQSRLTDESILVEGDFDYNGVPLSISRGKKLKIILDGEITTGSAKLSEEKLDQIIAIPRHLFRQMLHKKQGEKGFFLNLTPKETNDFLTDCLGLGHYKKNITDLDAKILDLSKMIGSLTMEYETGNAALTAAWNAKTALGEPPKREIDQGTIIELKAKMDEARARLVALTATHKAESDEFDKSRPQLESKQYDFTQKRFLEKRLEELKSESRKIHQEEMNRQFHFKQEIADLKVKQKEFDNLTRDITLYKEQAIKHALELKKVKSSICYTCSQSWINEEAAKQAQELEAKVVSCKKTSEEAFQKRIELGNIPALLLHYQEQAKPQVPIGIEPLDVEQYETVERIAQEDKEAQYLTELLNQTNKMKLDQFAEKQKVLKYKHFVDSEQYRGQVEVSQRALDVALGKFKAFEETVSRYEDSVKRFDHQIIAHQSRVKEKSDLLASEKWKIAHFDELRRALKSYLSCAFDEALEEISENATKLLRHIPNMANATIQLFGVRETKDGKVKEEVSAQIHMDGEENIDIRSLSGGERTSTDLAIDLSVIAFIQIRTNKGINLFILDEPFNGLEPVNIEMILEMLKNLNSSKKLLIVDHNAIVKEQISDRITIVRDGLLSKIL